MEKAKNDELYDALMSNLTQIEYEYLVLLQALPIEQRRILEEYFDTLEIVQHRLMQLSYWYED